MLGDVLAVQVRLTECVDAAVPVPVTPSVVVVGLALLVKVRVALAAPVVDRSNDTVNGTLWPAVIVIGRDSPLMVKAELLLVAAVTVTLAPLAVSVPVPVPAFPTATFPMAIVAGVAVSVPATATPVPDNAMFSVGFEPLDVTVKVPLALPADAGSNEMLKMAL